MTSENFVSAIVCTFNEEKCIQLNVRSILESDPRIQEVIIVDDNSTDKTKQKVLELHDRRIKFFAKQGKNKIRGKNTSIFVGAKLASYENLLMIDADTRVIKTSSMIDMLLEGADLVGGVISIKEDGRLLSHCEAIEYYISIQKARPWLLKKFHYINNVSGAFFGIKRKRLIENKVPNSVVGEDMYITQIGIIQKWDIRLSDSEVITYAIPNIKALFIQRCRWIYGYWTIINATGRKVPLIEMSTIWYRTLVTIAGIYAGSQFTVHYFILTFIVLALYFINEYYKVRSVIDSLLMMIYRQINFVSALFFLIFGRNWRVLR